MIHDTRHTHTRTHILHTTLHYTTHYTKHTHTHTHTHYNTSGLHSLLDIRDIHTMEAAPNTLDIKKKLVNDLRTYKQVHTHIHR